MTTVRFLTVLAASSLAGIAYAQNQATPTQPSTMPPSTAPAPGNNTSSPSSASSPNQRAVTQTPANEAPPNSNSSPTAASSPHQRSTLRMAEAGTGHSWNSMAVETPSGQSLGKVASVVPGLNGKKASGYVVVTDTNGTSTPVPYRTASSMVRHGKLVLSPSRFDHAPKVTQEDMQNTSDKAWRVKADHYWMKMGHKSKKQ